MCMYMYVYVCANLCSLFLLFVCCEGVLIKVNFFQWLLYMRNVRYS